ncbi:unnamed protein product [Calypogeia fissa]
MSTSHDQGGAVLYVVSRSGKVLRNHEEHHLHSSRRFADGDYFEGELEGWIFWGNNKGNGLGKYDGDHRSRRYQDAGGYIGGSTGFMGNPFGSRRVAWSTRIPFVEWGRENDSLQDFFSYIDWTQSNWRPGRKNSTTARRRHDFEARGWEDAEDMVFESPLVPLSLKPHDLFRSEWERWHSMERSYKIGLAQVAILQKLDIGSRWEPGTRELAARWAAWLLKMLRRTRSRPLQHLLFTMLSAVLPVICCSLVREQWTTVPDQELFRSVDIVWKALEKSYACFTAAQWEILQERLVACRKMLTQLEGLSGRCSRGAMPTEKLEDSLWRERLKSEMLNSRRASQDTYQVFSNSGDEELSNVLLKSEGVSALVKRALLEKLSARQARHMDANELHGSSGGPGRIVSLVCPISKKRIKVPARGRDCKHLSSFDLDSFLEEHAKNDRQRSDCLHRQKKPKLEKGAWCCPICGADATWPQIEVDTVLLRILEVLPEHMPQVCMLPNGRWRVVWTPVGLDLGQNDAKLTTVALYIPFKSTLEDDVYGVGDCEDFRHDTFKAIDQCLGYQQSFGCHEVQILHRAYKAWKEGVDHHLSKGSNAEQSKVQLGAKSTNAVWTDDHNSSRDMSGRLSSQQRIDSREQSRVRGENTGSVNGIKVDSGIAAGKDVARISDPETNDSQIIAGEDETEIVSARKVTSGPSQAREAMTYNCDVAQLRIGQHKSRPKQMAKKSRYVM